MQTTPSFYWHDYETFGLNRHTDRPAQFAGLRTTMDFEPMGETDVWYARPALDYLPQPEACLVTGITPQEAFKKGMPEAEFASKIYERFNTPGTIVVGYNNLRFDDEVTRAMFWRNLYDMYAHQYKNGCSRWDLFPFVLAVWALRDEGINWPLRETSDPEKAKLVSFRLEKLTEANGIEHDHAHDAASDVSATAALAKFFAAKVPKLWRWALEHRSKEHVTTTLESGRPCVWVTSTAGQRAGFLRFPMPVAVNPGNRNEYIVWDCRSDPSVLLGLSVEEIARRAFGPRSGLEENEERLPLSRLRVNTSPFVCGDLRIINARVQTRFDIDLEQIVANGEKLTETAHLLTGPVLEALSLVQGDEEERRQTAAEPLDCDLAMYAGGFINEADKSLMRDVHAMTAQTMAERAHEGRINFDDPRLNAVFFRMRARSWPEFLDFEEKARFQSHCRAVLEGTASGSGGIEKYFEDIDAKAEEIAELVEAGRLSEERAERMEHVLHALYDWGEHIAQCVENLDAVPEEQQRRQHKA